MAHPPFGENMTTYLSACSTPEETTLLQGADQKFCEQGLISGRPHSPATRKNNKNFLETFFNKYEYATIYLEL